MTGRNRMFGIFKEKRKKQSELEKLIERDGIDYAAKGCAAVIEKKLPTAEIAYQFIIEEIEAASQGSIASIKFARECGISRSEYKGAMNNSIPEVDGPGGPQQLILGLCMQLHPDMDLVVKFRTMIVDNVMQLFSLGKYNLQTSESMPDENSSRWVDLLTLTDGKDTVAFLSFKVPLSFNLLKKYKDRWCWGNINDGLSHNKSLPWSLWLVESFKDNWCWCWGIPQNKNLMRTPELFDQYLKFGRWYNHSTSFNGSDIEKMSGDEFLENVTKSVEQIKNDEYYFFVWSNLSSN
jgi:hypothetical protein